MPSLQGRPSKRVRRLVAHLLIRLLAVSPCPVEVQVWAALFPASIVLAVALAADEVEAGVSRPGGVSNPTIYPDGRLKSHTDAFNKTITYEHSLAARQEVVTDREGGVRVLEYDARGNVTKETDPNGKVTTRTFDVRDNKLTETDPNLHTTIWTYDLADNVTSVKNHEGDKTEYTYNAKKQVLTTKDPRGKVTTNVYDAKGNLEKTTDAAGNVTAYTYDAQGNVKTQKVTVDGVVQTTSYDYDAAGRLTKETDARGHVTSSTYDSNGNRKTQTTTRTLPGGAVETLVTSYTYDKDGRLTETKDADGTVTKTVYDALGRQKESYDKLNRVTKYTYDDMGRQTLVEYPDDTREESGYDAEGRRTSFKDRAGRTTTYEYDGLGRLRKTKYPGGAVVESRYDDAGRLRESIDARLKTTIYAYDAAGRRTSVKNPLSHETVFGYDRAGNQTTVKDPLGRTTTYEYDDVGRRVKTIFPDLTFTTTAYDNLGRRISETDQAGKVTQFKHDELGRLVKVIDAALKETTYGYDELSNRVLQRDANGQETRFEYDKLGRETKRILPGGEFETKTYDLAGNLETRTDFKGVTTTYEYDVVNRLLSRTSPDGVVSFTYTPTGRRETATDVRGMTRYTYDVRDRVETITYPDGRKLEFCYDPNGNRVRLTAILADGVRRSATFTYDDASRLDVVTDPNGKTYDHDYDDNGNREALAYPNGVRTAYTYDTLNRLKTLTTSHAVSGVIQGYTFELGAAGNRQKITVADGTVHDYTYDDLYRLTRERIAGTFARDDVFTYDAVGNRKTRSTVAAGAPAGTTYAYDDRDRLRTENATTYGWDTNGNLTSKSGEATYGWDVENRLVRVTKTDGTVVTHAYDADGNRVQTKVTPATGPPVVTNFLVDTTGALSHVVAESDQAGAFVAYYVRGDDLLSVIRPGQQRYVHADGIGSIRRLTDDAGAVTDTYAYAAFGELIARAGTDPQPYAFSGEPLDVNSGWQYHRARWLDPTIARFSSVDPFDGLEFEPTTLHRYQYSRNSPLDFVDPSGEHSLPATITAIASAVTVALSNFPAQISNAFARGGPVLGQLWQRMGTWGNLIARNVFMQYQAYRPALQIDSEQWINGRRLDFLIRLNNLRAYIEAKYGLPWRDGPALDRLVAQMKAGVDSGVRTVLFTVREPSNAQIQLLKKKLGDAYYQQIDTRYGVIQLWEFMVDFFGPV